MTMIDDSLTADVYRANYDNNGKGRQKSDMDKRFWWSIVNYGI